MPLDNPAMNDARMHVQLADIYRRVHEAWLEHQSSLFKGACGYSILGSKPSHRPHLMIIGENPGFATNDVGGGPHVETTLPTQSYLDGESWKLKDVIRELFVAADAEPILRNAVFTNFLFFKSSSLCGGEETSWSRVAPDVRKELTATCLTELFEIVEILQPDLIMVLGMAAFDRHVSDPKLELKASDGRRRLIGSGNLANRPAIGLMHPTGARWSDKDRLRAADWLREALKA